MCCLKAFALAPKLASATPSRFVWWRQTSPSVSSSLSGWKTTERRFDPLKRQAAMPLRCTFASRRALSSVGQSRRLIISWSQVQALQGAQFEVANRLQNASACVSLPSVSTEAELRRAFSSAGSERSPHTREVTGSSPVLPTNQKKPRTQVRGFLLAHASSPLDAGSQNKPSGPRPQGF